MLSKLTMAAAAAAAVAFSTPALASDPFGTCGAGDVGLPGAVGYSFVACSGFYEGNLNNASDFDHVVNDHLASAFPGVTFGSGIIEQLITNTTPVNLATPMFGDTVIGVHWGGGTGGGVTAFYRLNIDNNYTGLAIAAANPTLTSGGALSNVALYATQPIPEPSAYAMMVAGLAVLGFLGRRRKVA